MDKLLPCPFCGGGTVHHEKYREMVKCSTDWCPASMGWSPIDTWNTRHTPEGWQLVPVEATYEMIRSARGWRECDGREGLLGEPDMFDRAYHAMLAAAPKWGGG